MRRCSWGRQLFRSIQIKNSTVLLQSLSTVITRQTLEMRPFYPTEKFREINFQLYNQNKHISVTGSLIVTAKFFDLNNLPPWFLKISVLESQKIRSQKSKFFKLILYFELSITMTQNFLWKFYRNFYYGTTYCRHENFFLHID